MNDVPMLETLGGCRVDGRPVRHRRAAELAAALVLSDGAAPRDWLSAVLFEEDPSPSSLPTLAMRARRIGLDVRYERESGAYRIGEEIRCDVVEFLFLLSHGYVAQALELYKGPFLARSDSPFAVQTRAHLEQRVVEAVMDSGDTRLLTAAGRVVRHPAVQRELSRHVAAPMGTMTGAAV
ncbi:BTAD domain-containing putative transcriptional regulator [Nocardiopsis sp. N85]|uniref:BTAD domain-containing putative transcriptional regulator n=1 Tax=Nocardiopsis sp. N85 TaxID=3029400 RepID=UPI00237F3DC1|nr:BTAD domain-containing putative transcriptional regulator [Nocardiopsis sp. N85]MDE3723093.1 BTAD domain-containing putative transcriptional regulator [Nocardiopsis sp. N85]